MERLVAVFTRYPIYDLQYTSLYLRKSSRNLPINYFYLISQSKTCSKSSIDNLDQNNKKNIGNWNFVCFRIFPFTK